MRILIAGGSGFVGSHLIDLLLSKGHQPKLLLRNQSNSAYKNIESVVADPLNPKTLTGVMERCDAVINLIGIIREFRSRGITYDRAHYDATVNLAIEAKKAGVSKWIQMSANGAKLEGAVSKYQSSKFRAEEFLKKSGFDLTIFRPSLIFGSPPLGKGEFCTQMFNLMKTTPIMPIFGDGEYLLQPISVKDVAKVFESALHQKSTEPQIYHLAGREKFSYIKVLDIIAEGGGIKPRIKVRLPYKAIRPVISLLGNLPLFPATVDQIDMLVAGNTIQEDSFIETFGIEPEKFSPENLSYLLR